MLKRMEPEGYEPIENVKESCQNKKQIIWF